MKSIADSLKAISERAIEPLPDDAQCSVCKYFDIQHPDVRRILSARDPDGRQKLLYQAQCKCLLASDKAKRDDDLRRMQANMPPPSPLGPRTFLRFERRTGAESALEAAQRFALLAGPPVLLLVGQTGTGKSHLLEAIGQYVLHETAHSVRYDTGTGLLDRLRTSFLDGSEMSMVEMMAWYQRRKVLLIDDLGREKATDFAVERLTALIDERMRQGWWTALTTNLGRDEMAERLGERLASRLYQTNADLQEVRRVTITASDYRGGA